MTLDLSPNSALIPIIGSIGIILILAGFSLRERGIGLAMMGGGMAIVLAMIAFKIYLYFLQ
jgi:hypothetical protein